MKVDVLDLNGKKLKQIELPYQFTEPYHPNLIKRAVAVIMSKLRQVYGHKEGAGMGYSAKISRRRRNYKGAYGHGYSRVPRKTMLRRGRQFHWVGAVAPGTVGGRRAHGPNFEKDFSQKINKKERKKAIRSLLGASFEQKKMIVFEDKLEALKKTKEVVITLENSSLKNELEKVTKTVRSGKGKMRGRKYKTKKGLLFVVSKTCDLSKSARSLLGADVVNVSSLNVSDIAKGSELRTSVWTEGAVKKVGVLFK